MHRINVWIERISALYRNLMRTYANENGLQLVHLEILQFLHSCNRYSNTVQALSDYLGQTKGSISQSVTLLEAKELLMKNQSSNDKRVFHLNLTSKGKSLITAFKESMDCELPDEVPAEMVFEQTLRSLQRKNKLKEFGICKYCQFNESQDENRFRCGMTSEILVKVDTEKICGEYKKRDGTI